jgi:DeoR/GlpR family transcriptional regulator of sugar metabolism
MNSPAITGMSSTNIGTPSLTGKTGSTPPPSSPMITGIAVTSGSGSTPPHLASVSADNMMMMMMSNTPSHHNNNNNNNNNMNTPGGSNDRQSSSHTPANMHHKISSEDFGFNKIFVGGLHYETRDGK